MLRRLFVAAVSLFILSACNESGSDSPNDAAVADVRQQYAAAAGQYNRVKELYNPVLERLRAAAAARDLPAVQRAAADLSAASQAGSVYMLEYPWPEDLQQAADNVASLLASLITPYERISKASTLEEITQAIDAVPSNDAAFQIMQTKLSMVDNSEVGIPEFESTTTTLAPPSSALTSRL